MAKQKKRRPGPGGPGRSQPKPHWQPIEALAMVAAHIDGMLQADREQYETLLQAIHGRNISASAPVSGPVRLVDQLGQLVGIGEPTSVPGVLHPAVVLR